MQPCAMATRFVLSFEAQRQTPTAGRQVRSRTLALILEHGRFDVLTWFHRPRYRQSRRRSSSSRDSRCLRSSRHYEFPRDRLSGMSRHWYSSGRSSGSCCCCFYPHPGPNRLQPLDHRVYQKQYRSLRACRWRVRPHQGYSCCGEEQNPRQPNVH